MDDSTPPSSIRDLIDLGRWRADVATDDQGFYFVEDGQTDDEWLSFADLDRRVRAVAAHIADRVDRGDRVLLLYPPSMAYVEAFLGCVYAAAIAVPAYPPSPGRLDRTLPRLQNIVDDAGATLVATTQTIATMASEVSDQAPGLADLDWLATDGIDDAAADQWKPPRVDEKTVAFLQYTSGSTGRPKGVILDHETLLGNEALIYEAIGSGRDQTTASWVPLYHDMGLIGGVIQPLYGGCSAVLMSPIDFLKRPPFWLETITRFEATMSTGPNFSYDLTVRKTPPSMREQLDLSSWRVACNGAEPVRMETMERFARYFAPCGFDATAFMPSYGLAEVGLVVAATPGPDKPRAVEYDDHSLVSCGPPLGDFDVRIVDPDSLEVLGPRQVGEIWLRRGSVAPGYWGHDDSDEKVFRARTADGQGPFLRTGDLGLVVDGELVITGRLDDLIVIRGVNHYPHDIEATVEDVDEALRPGCGAAFSIEVQEKSALVIVQEVGPQIGDDADDLMNRIHQQVSAAHGVAPLEVVLIEPKTIEKTSSGKIRRFAVKDAYERRDLATVARTGDPRMGSEPDHRDRSRRKSSPQTAEQNTDVDARRTSVESWLVDRLAEYTGQSRGDIDLRQPFSAYGIDSARAVGMVGELERWLDRSIEATALYDHPTVADLAAHLAGEDADLPKSESTRSPGYLTGVDRAERRIAVVGMACRFPGADNLEEYRKLLEDGREAVGEARGWRRGFPGQRGGFIGDIEAFDARFFGISPGEARMMDPQQRLVLETSWHALEDAGWTRQMLAGSPTGVFVGQSGSDFARMYHGPPVRAGSGMAPSMTANRLSYWLDLRGPSVVVDTACSSSLTALDRAVSELRRGRCQMAIVGGVNAMLSADVSRAFEQAQMLSPAGRCRSFDADADGYVRGEGCGAVVLRPLDDAVEAGDRIRAVVLGSAVNHDGRTNGLMAPASQAQREVVDNAMIDAGVSPKTIGFVEGQGTATELGDAIETRALRAVFDADSERGRCWLGSVKAQIGHLEAAAGIAGLIKAVLLVEQGMVTPQANFHRPNPACEFEQSTLCVPTQIQDWPGLEHHASSPRRAGVSAFGFGGTNAHVVIEQPPPRGSDDDAGDGDDDHGYGLVGLSAANEKRLRARAAALADDDEMWNGLESVRDLGWSLATQRDAGPVRWTAVSNRPRTVRRRLAAWADQQPHHSVDEVSARSRSRMAVICPGERAPTMAMGRRLASELPLFDDHLKTALAAVEAADDSRVADVLLGTDESTRSVSTLRPARFCLEIALFRTLRDWGMNCDAVMGWGVGEVSAACIANAIELDEAARFVVESSRRIEDLRESGTTMIVDEQPSFVEEAIDDLGMVDVDVSADFGARAVVAGHPDALERLRQALGDAIDTQSLQLDAALYSSMLEPLCQTMESFSPDVNIGVRGPDWISASEGRYIAGDEALGDRFWAGQLRGPIAATQAVEALVGRGIDVMVELGTPSTTMVMESTVERVPSVSVGGAADGGAEGLMEFAAWLWRCHDGIDPEQINAGGSRVDLAKTPYLRDQYWPDSKHMRRPEKGR